MSLEGVGTVGEYVYFIFHCTKSLEEWDGPTAEYSRATRTKFHVVQVVWNNQ